MPSRFRIICTGDVHLGRRPARAPRRPNELSVQHVWAQCIEEALNRSVDAFVLTGDIVDNENKMYEAFGPLERGIRRLLEAGINVVAVAGNHDYDTFPRLVRSINDDRFHLLGQGGNWEAVILENSDGARVRFIGWSFPSRYVPRSPLEDGHLEATSMPTVGVLHCDAGQAEGRYAPVRREALARAPVDAWLLGHIHAPNEHRQGGQLQLYTGSLQPLDPGETGTHGAWLVNVGPSDVNEERIPLATLRYDRASVDVSGFDTADDVEHAVIETIQDGMAHAARTWPNVRHVVYRLVYDGRTALHTEIERQAKDVVADLAPSAGEVHGSIYDYEIQTRPDYDLGELARGNDPVGVLAELLLDLEAGRDTDAVRNVMQQAKKNVQPLYRSTRYDPLQRDPERGNAPSSGEIRQWAIRQGYRLLDAIHTPADR